MGELEQRLFEFIEAKVRIKVNTESLVFEDLGIDGLDADRFVEEFSHQFDVDMSGFNPDEFYSSEYELNNIFLTVYKALFRRKLLKKRIFRVSHLLNVIKEKKWTDPPPASARL